MSQEITVVAVGITHMKGTANKGQGNAYEFANLAYMKNVNPHFSNSYMERKQAGFDLAEIPFPPDPAVWSEFMTMPFGQKVTLILEPDPQDIQKSICVGFKPAAKA